MARADTQLKFRIPPDLKPRLEHAARENKRSINMEVIARLEQSLEAETQRGVGKGKAANPGAISGNVLLRLEEVEGALAKLQRRVSLIAMAEIRARKSKL
jgi:hypothetical protein